mmetsp:Transcript_20442/g.25246  ORF Transcript_20442/g.25246 Transcript_20442/m.25246 type:complete len:239 (+) Transcript_20442:26-742(+)
MSNNHTNVDPERVLKAKEWIEEMLSINIDDYLFDALRDGVILCCLLNKISGKNLCKKFKKSNKSFVCRINISIYLRGCKKYGLPDTDVFETRDLYDKFGLYQVLNNIYSLSGMALKKGYPGNHIGIKYHTKNKRKFTKKQLIESRKKGTIPIWMKGDKTFVNNSKAYDIIKTSKAMQKHSNTMSILSKGSKSYPTMNNIDSYGIIKIDPKLSKQKKNIKHNSALNVIKPNVTVLTKQN